MPRYVLLRHECPSNYKKPSHWDFMLEREGVLLTWELRELPKGWGEALEQAVSETEIVRAIPLPNHRLAYLDYEGPVSGDRGHVTRCDSGSYRTVCQDETGLEITLTGEKFNCSVKLTNCKSDWQLEVRD